jgi:aerobic carbon-monoxide dehydrogenase large subunit
VDAAFAKAAHVTTLSFVNNRLIPNAMEPRAANAQLHAARRQLHAVRGQPEPARRAAADVRLRARPARAQGARDRARRRRRLRLKIFLYAEETALVWASKQMGRPIKWTAERSESFLTDAHGRDHVTTAELAMDKDGNFLALRVTPRQLGAYLSTFAPASRPSCTPRCWPGSTRRRRSTCEVKAVFTNTAPVDAYRGAGRPEATYVVERIVETAAREMKMDPAEIRRRNFITEFPYADAGGPDLRHRQLRRHLDKAIELADVAGFPARKAPAEAKGLLRGLGYSCYIEACGLAPSNIAGALGARAGLFEAGEVRVHPTGR